MASEIARGISARLSPEQSQALGAARSVNPRAYAQYLLGAEQTNLRTVESFHRSVEYLNRSVALDSTFAPAWGAMAMTHAIALFFTTITADSARRVIEPAAARAIARSASTSRTSRSARSRSNPAASHHRRAQRRNREPHAYT